MPRGQAPDVQSQRFQGVGVEIRSDLDDREILVAPAAPR
jgi:hypothetical protein